MFKKKTYIKTEISKSNCKIKKQEKLKCFLIYKFSVYNFNALVSFTCVCVLYIYIHPVAFCQKENLTFKMTKIRIKTTK